MEISTAKSGDDFILRLQGRFDAGWCDHVKTALDAAVRAGEHHLRLDLADVTYISSAGLRVLLSVYKQLKAINGRLGVINASPAVQDILELAGLDLLLIKPDNPTQAAFPPATDAAREHHATHARHEVWPTAPDATPVPVSVIGSPAALTAGTAAHPLRPTQLGSATLALGVGALGSDTGAAAEHLGEFLAVAGTAACQPADGANRPDFTVAEGGLLPEGQLLLGLVAHALPGRLSRFEATSDRGTVGLTELAATALELAGSDAVVIALLAETAGLVGASLRQAPVAAAAPAERFGFPAVRDWLSFSSERSHRDSTTLVVGVAAKPGSSFDPLLRPLAAGSSLVGHFHAAAFPYRPLQKGRLDLATSVTALFSGPAPTAVLHLLADTREFNGAGESEFYRGALWFSPTS